MYIYICEKINIIPEHRTYEICRSDNLEDIHTNFINIYEIVNNGDTEFVENILLNNFERYVKCIVQDKKLYSSDIIYFIDLIMDVEEIKYKKLSKQTEKLIKKMNVVRDCE
jgi:hypothetical protein